MGDLVNLHDSLNHRLRAAVKAAGMLVDDIIIMLYITHQVGIVETAKSDVSTPKEMIGQYTQQLFSKGQSRLSDFENKNSLLLEKMDYIN